MTSKRELESRILELENKFLEFRHEMRTNIRSMRQGDSDYYECSKCGGLFNKNRMATVEVRHATIPFRKSYKYFCEAHTPQHDIEERGHEIVYKKREGERVVNYGSEKKEPAKKKPATKKRKKKKEWTKREIDELLRRLENGDSIETIAKEMGRDRGSVTSKYTRMGIRRTGTKYARKR